MNRFFTTLFASLLLAINVMGENVIIGDRLPDIDIRKWLMDIEPSDAEYTCYLFYHSQSPLCQKCLATLERSVAAHKSLNMVIITKEEYGDAGVTLTRHLNDRTGVAFDDNGRTFRSFGVKYIPFCVISRKHKVVWCGNGNLLNDSMIEKILTK